MAIFRESNTIVVPQDPAIVKNLVTKQMIIPPGEQIIRENSTGNTLIPTNIVNSDGQEVLANTVVTEQNSNVYVTNININEDQNFITNVEGGGASLCVGTLDSANNYTNISCNINRLGFDTGSGFDVTDLGSGLTKIAMNSTFKCWEVNGSSGLIACGLDTVNFVAGPGMTIAANNSASPKTLTLCSAVSLDSRCSLAIGGGLANSCGTGHNGCNNIAIGKNAGYCNTCGYGNIYIGCEAGRYNTTGFSSVYIGQCAGYYAQGNESLYIGCLAGENDVDGANNTYIGLRAGQGTHCGGSCSTTIYGVQNTYIGSFAGWCSACTANNTFVGYDAGKYLITGSNNTVIGVLNLSSTSSLECTVLVGAGTCERIKVDDTGLYINGTIFKTPYDSVSSITGATGVVTHNISLGVIFNHTSIAGNFTANFTNFNLNSGQAANVVLILNQGATAYIPSAVQIAGVAQTINWQGGAVPTGNANKKDIASFSVTNIGATCTVFGQLIQFG